MSESNQRCNVLSLTKRVQVIKEYESFYPKPKILALATKFNVGCSQIRNILFNQDAILKAYEIACARKKKYSPYKCRAQVPENPKSDKKEDDDKIHRVLSATGRINVAYDNTSKNPKPTFSSLANKHNVSSYQISNAVLGQDKTREGQIKFLGMVMYEYLQRALYHNESLDDLKFQKKAAEVKEYIGITKFRPSYLWLKGFKKKYDIDDLRLESLRTKIIFTDEKQSSLEPVDLVRFVRQHKNALLKSELINQLTTTYQSKTWVFSAKNMDEIQIKKTKYTPPLRKNYTTTVPKITKRQTDINVKKSAVEISPTQLSGYIGPHLIEEELLDDISTNQTQQQAQSVLKNLEQHFKKTDLNRIIVKGRKPKVKKAVGERDVTQNRIIQMPSSHDSEDDEIVTIFQIIEDEAPASPAANNQLYSSPSLTYVYKNSQQRDLNDNINGGITIKTEPYLFEGDDDERMETSHNLNSPYILPDHSQQFSLAATDNYGELVIKTEPLQLDEDIKPTIVFERSEELVIENKRDTNDQKHSPRIMLDKVPHSNNSPPPDILHEDIKPTLTFERSNESVLDNNVNSPEDRTHSSSLAAISKRTYYSDSPLPDINTPEEAAKLLKVLEKYAALKENYRAVGLLIHLEDLLKESPK